MFHITTARWLLTVPLACAALPAFAQVPLDHRSAMAGYRHFADEKPLPWKEANEVVHSRGGWRAYAKEAEVSAPGKAGADAGSGDAHGHAGHAMSMPSPEAADVPDAHGSHGTHGAHDMPSTPKGRP